MHRSAHDAEMQAGAFLSPVLNISKLDFITVPPYVDIVWLGLWRLTGNHSTNRYLEYLSYLQISWSKVIKLLVG